MPGDDMIRAAVYCRISEDPRGSKLGVERQEVDCRRLIETKGWTVADVYVDNDVSATTGRHRPAYARMLDDIKAGIIDAVVVWDQDRLVRHPKELEHFFEVCDAAGVTRLASVGGDVDLATGEGILVARIKGAVAAEEVRKLRARITRKARELAEAGKSSGGGTRPFGYEADFRTVRESEAALIREAVDRILAGDAVRGLLTDWTRRGVQTVQGGPWHPNTIRRLLISWRIAGVRAVNVHATDGGTPVTTAEWPAIVSREKLEAVRAILLDPARNKVGDRARRYPLRGYLRCGLCGATLVSRPRGDGARRYLCAKGPGYVGCNRIGVLAEPLERMVRDDVIERLAAGGLRAALDAADDGRHGDAVAELAEIEDALDRLAVAFFADRRIGASEYWAAHARLDEQRNAARRRVEQAAERSVAATLPVDLDGLRRAYDEADVPRKRAIIGLVVSEITVGPGVRGLNRFDPRRITYTGLRV